jgi:hypothetical protein
LGQIACDVGCNSGLVIVNGHCQQPGNNPPQACSANGQSCVADFVSGTHCCQAPGQPLPCVYGTCHACVLHGQECVAANQICCSAKNGDMCRLDIDSGKSTCGIPDAPGGG